MTGAGTILALIAFGVAVSSVSTPRPAAAQPVIVAGKPDEVAPHKDSGPAAPLAPAPPAAVGARSATSAVKVPSEEGPVQASHQSRAGAADGQPSGAANAGAAEEGAQTVNVIRTSLVFTLLALLPAIAVCMTPFVRIVVVLSMIRHAFGMPETPPSQVLVALSLFLTVFLMLPTLEKVNADALQPLLAGTASVQQALDAGSGPMRVFMLRQVHDQDIKTVYDIAKRPLPTRAANVGLMELTTAFMLNELRVSFKIGFVILLPFLLIDLVVSSILLGLGMMMVPPSTLSLPIKVLMFVLIDGWSLVLQGVVGSFR